MRSWIRDSQEGTALSMFADTLKYLFANGLLDEYSRRIDNLLAAAGKLRGPLRTEIIEIHKEFMESVK